MGNRIFALNLRRVIPILLILACLPIGGCDRQKRRSSWPAATETLRPASEVVHIRLEKIPSGIRETPYLGIRAETGKGSALLLVDTGTSLTLLRESLRGDLNLSKRTRAVNEAVDGQPTDIFLTSSLRAGPFEFTNEAVAFLPDERIDALTKNSGNRIDGILGATLLNRGEIEIRGGENSLTIRPFDRSVLTKETPTVPLIFIPDSNTYAIHLSAAGVGGCRLLFDTGTNVGLVLDEHRPLARKVMESPQVGLWNYESVHGAHEVRVYNLAFDISGTDLIFPAGSAVCVDSRRKGPLDGVVGAPAVWKTPIVILNRQREAASFLNTEP